MTKIVIFISDVGYGHMVRQRSIINEIERQFKNPKILILNYSNIDIIEQTFKEKYEYLKWFNNIKLFKTKLGYFDLKKTNTFFNRWPNNKKKIFGLKKIIKGCNVIISDFVPEAFELAKQMKIKSFGVCHYTWSWFFKKSGYKNSKNLQNLQKIEMMANKIFIPPFAPKNMIKFDDKKIVKINFILEKKKIFSKDKNKKPIILIMDNGTKTLSRKISDSLKFMDKNTNFKFYVGSASLNKSDLDFVLKSKNITPINGLTSIYNEINNVDFVIARAGFNTISECLVYKKPALYADEKNNPEIKENLKKIKSESLGAFIKEDDWGKNFNKRVNFFLKYEQKKIKNNLNKYNFLYNGAQQVVKTIKKEIYND